MTPHTSPETKEGITVDQISGTALDRIASAAGLSDADRALIDETIGVVNFFTHTLDLDEIANKRGGSDERAEAPAPVLASDPRKAYIAVRLAMLTDELFNSQ